jgi:hypothetical protein
MHISQATTLNWGGLPNRDYPLGTYTLLAGETGSGKTSLIDAIVAVIGGGGTLKSKFNTAQSQSGQSSKKSQRTLASYITGSNGMERFLRPGGAHGYVCISWKQDANDGTYGVPFTAIVGAEAGIDRDAVLAGDIVRILVRGHNVGLADLMSSAGTVLKASELIVALRVKYGQTAVRDFKSAGEYLAMLYAYLKGDTHPVSREEADAAVKAFVSAIAYRQPNDIDGLIREEILESVNNEGLIQRLIETIREVNRLKLEATRMEKNIRQLEDAEGDLRSAFEAFMDERMFKALIDIRKAEDVREALDAKRTDRDQRDIELSQTIAYIDNKKEEQDRRQKQLDDIRLLIGKNDVYATKRELERLIEEQQRLMDAVLVRIMDATRGFNKASSDVSLMEGMINAIPDLSGQQTAIDTLRRQFSLVSLPALDAAVQAINDGLGEMALEEMTRVCAAIVTSLTIAWDAAVNGEYGLRAAFNQAFRNADKEYDEVANEARDVLRRIERLKTGQVEYPPAVELFLDRLRNALPRAKARVLCDAVEVTKPEWQSALEGYIGRDRFTVLYDRAFEADVVALAKVLRREVPGYRGDISVPQLSLAISDRPHVEPASIVHLLTVQHDEEAAGYLKARYGRTVMVSDTNTLKNTRSGIMRDGWSTQGYRYQQRLCSDDALVFGADIRRRQREVLLKRGAELEKESDKLISRKKLLNQALAVANPATVALDGGDPKRFHEAAAFRQMAAEEMSKLDLSSIEKLEEQTRSIQSELTTLSGAVTALSETKGGLQTIIRGLDLEISKLEAELADLQPIATAASAAHHDLMKKAFIAHDEWPKRLADEIAEKRPITSYERRSNERANTATNAVNDANNKFAAYNRDALEFQRLQIHPFSYVPRLGADTVVTWMQDMWRQLREQIHTQKETGLPERRVQCEMAERSFTSSFTTDFCATVLSNVEGRADTINALNANLERINFGGDSYKLVSFLKPEYEDYIHLFQKIRGLTETRKADLDLFNAPELLPEERDTLFRIRDLLLDDRDAERALPELRRIADYRNYRTYDFQRGRGDYTVLLSKWGTGSGGETETPVYVIRVAVMASAFKLFSPQKKAHFRSIFMDEVFATMDETRTRRVLHFLKELGLQIVCAAPTRSMAAVLDEFDVRINFSTYVTPGGDRSDVNVINLDQARVRDLYEAHRGAVSEDATASFEKGAEPPLRIVTGEQARTALSGGS